jgi:hypothetical protein
VVDVGHAPVKTDRLVGGRKRRSDGVRGGDQASLSATSRCRRPVLVEAGVERGRGNGMHALRHWYGAVLLQAGVSIKALSDYLGHADPGFTLRTYTHLMPSSEAKAREVVDGTFARWQTAHRRPKTTSDLRFRRSEALGARCRSRARTTPAQVASGG